LDRLRRSCRIAALAFDKGRIRLKAGLLETEAAANFRRPLFTDGVAFEDASRADGYVFCMAGEHSAEAFGAYARSRASTIRTGDLVLTHCNSHADGYWTDITRTWCMGQPSHRQQQIYEAIFEARQAAMAAIRPGVEVRNVDRAARDVMRAHGFAENFKHPTGHGVGFAAIDHNARPRLHPASEDRLESGMVFNVEPAAYFDGFGGVRHCDMVAVTPRGCEVLTPFHCIPEDLICDSEEEGVGAVTRSKVGRSNR
jgi:Xaa-Pro aminopeptidase